MRVGIIGGGAAGLTAAYELGKQGYQVAVYERAPFLGGQASTFDVGGAPLERGYHHLFTSDTEVLDLIDEIGLGDRMRWVESKVGTLYDGKIYDFVTPLDLLKFTPLSLIDRFRLGLTTLRLRYKKDWRDLESVSAVEWLRKKGGRRVYEVFWSPMLRGKFGEEYFQTVGMTWVWGKMHTRFASRGKGMAREMLGYPAGSFGEVFDMLGRRIAEQGGEVHTGVSVRRIVVEDGHVNGLRVQPMPATWTSPQPLASHDEEDSSRPGPQSQWAEPFYEAFDAVIATTPSYDFINLVPQLPEEYLSRLSGVNYMSAVLIILVLKRPLSSIYWLNIADRSIPFVGAIEHTNLIPSEHYCGKHIVYLSNYLSPQHHLYKLGHKELLQEYLPHLRKINPEFDASWVETSFHHRLDWAQPVVGVDYSTRIPDHRTPFRGAYLVNTTQVYPEDRGTNYSVRMGRRVVRMLMDDFKG